MEVLQTSALPLGYAAMGRRFTPADSSCPNGRCQDTRARRGHGTTVERERGFEPPTSTLARLHSTTELLPQRATGDVGVDHSKGAVKKTVSVPAPCVKSRDQKSPDPPVRQLAHSGAVMRCWQLGGQ